MQLLFEEIPEALGIKINKDDTYRDELQEKLRLALSEMGMSLPALSNKVQAAMLNIFGGHEINDLQQKQQERIKALLGICDDNELKPVMQALYGTPITLPNGVGVLLQWLKSH